MKSKLIISYRFSIVVAGFDFFVLRPNFRSIFALKNDRIIFARFPHFYSLNLFSSTTDDQNQGPSRMFYFAPCHLSIAKGLAKKYQMRYSSSLFTTSPPQTPQPLQAVAAMLRFNQKQWILEPILMVVLFAWPYY